MNSNVFIILALDDGLSPSGYYIPHHAVCRSDKVTTKFCAHAELVLVRVEQGLLRGSILERTTGNGTYYSFKGIPYAAPPVGNLRFKEPQPPLSWEGERCAKEHGSICPQMQSNTTSGNEDCLFLNVYTPVMKPETPLSVMFYIHGGAFVTGSGNDNELRPDFLLDHNVIVVTINYRLGALGFLSLDIEEAPGNAGLKDQVAALQWVKKNIANFGGDPKNVTIFGQSSGSAAVSLQVLSPRSKGLFSGAIAMSGVFFSDHFVQFEPQRTAFLLTQELGLYTKDPVEALNFLQGKSVESLIKAKPFVSYFEIPRGDVVNAAPFTPVIEKKFNSHQFMTEDPEKILIEGRSNDVVLIIGHTTEEGTLKVVALKDYFLEYFPIYREILVPFKIAKVKNAKTVLELADRIQYHYFGNKLISEETIRELITFYTYYNYIYDIYRYVEMWTKSGKRAYFYNFSCFSERNVNGLTGVKYGVREATHADDLPYLFDGPKYNLTLNKGAPSYKMIRQTSSLYTNYAKHGNPTPDNSLGVIWMEYNSKNKSYLDIGLNLEPRIYNTKPQIDFWRSIFQSAGLRFS